MIFHLKSYKKDDLPRGSIVITTSELSVNSVLKVLSLGHILSNMLEHPTFILFQFNSKSLPSEYTISGVFFTYELADIPKFPSIGEYTQSECKPNEELYFKCPP